MNRPRSVSLGIEHYKIHFYKSDALPVTKLTAAITKKMKSKNHRQKPNDTLPVTDDESYRLFTHLNKVTSRRHSQRGAKTEHEIGLLCLLFSS